MDALAQHVDQFETVEHYVVMGEGDLSKLPGAISYEELLERQEPGFDYPEIDDRAAAGLCFTSGTTGNPKGVLYSHRSNILHTMGQCMADGFGDLRAPTASCRWCRCSTPTRGACPTRRAWRARA